MIPYRESESESELERELARRLAELAAVPGTPSAVDVARARQEGVRRRRQRRASLVGGVFTVAAAAMAMLLGLGGLLPASGARSAAAGRPPAAPTHESLTAKADFGWLPATMTGISYVYEDQHWVTRAADPSLSMSAWLTVYPKGATPPTVFGDSHGGIAEVTYVAVHNGLGLWFAHPYLRAFGPNLQSVVVRDQSDGVRWETIATRVLRWQTPRGQWVELDTRGLPVKTALQDAVRIAEDVRIGEHAVPLPFYVTGLPDRSQYRSGFYASPGLFPEDAWDAGGSYRIRGTQDWVQWTVRPHQAPAVPANSSLPLRCVVEHGLDLCVSGTGTGLRAFGGLDAVLLKVIPLGPDRKTWITAVVR